MPFCRFAIGCPYGISHKSNRNGDDIWYDIIKSGQQLCLLLKLAAKTRSVYVENVIITQNIETRRSEKRTSIDRQLKTKSLAMRYAVQH